MSDQKDREDFNKMTDKQRMELNKRDNKRRMCISEIFAEGCVKTASDYHDSSMIFQHGEVPDHCFQAFYFANKAEVSGNTSDLTPDKTNDPVLRTH